MFDTVWFFLFQEKKRKIDQDCGLDSFLLCGSHHYHAIPTAGSHQAVSSHESLWKEERRAQLSTEESTSEMLSLKIPLPILPSLSCHANLPRLAAGMDSLRVNQLQVWVINLQSTPKLPDNVRMELPQSWMHALSSLPNWSQSRDEQKWSMFVAAVPRVSTSCVMFWKFLKQQGSQRSKFILGWNAQKFRKLKK